MMYFRTILAGAAVGFLVAVVPACGPTQTSRCLVSNCNGCCDEVLGCLPGTEVLACGAGAVSCQKCSSGQACVDGACRIAPSYLTDDAGTDAGASCGPGNCTGCCDANNQCVGGNQTSACGINGAACAACTGNDTCQAGSCSGASCNGCLDAVGTCQPGNSNSACGAAGNVCVSCLPGQQCLGGGCSGGGCNAQNCADGCCSGDTCVRGQPNNVQCGTGGAACVGCPSGQACQANGTCSGGVPTDGGIPFPLDGGLISFCDPSNCNGCCQLSINPPGFQCMPGTETSACGTGGNSCSICIPIAQKCGAAGSCVAAFP